MLIIVNKDERINQLKLEIEEKEKRLQSTQDNLDHLTHELIETKQRHENQIASLIEEHNTLLNMKVMENDLIVKDLKQEKEANVKRLNKLLETQKSDNDKIVFELKENLETKTNENNDLNARVKEFEETLAKDKDERIQRLLDTQHNLEKEIESLKAALEIKNIDIYDLRTKNNELITKVDNYTDLNAKVRRFEQEVEQLTVILNKKQEAER
jgi:chromosome segregation ATPase